MNNIYSEHKPKRKKEKPIGVHILTAFDFIAIGLIPAIATLWVGFGIEIEISLAWFAISLGLALLTMGAAVWAWTGDNPGRLLLLALVTVSSALIIFNNISILSADNVEGAGTIRSVINILHGLFRIAINWWYFNLKKTIDYYKG
jgi:hypothetical protein